MRNGIANRRDRIAFGDFQTPRVLADQVCSLLLDSGVCPQSIVEPTCGVGGFLLAAADAFPSARQLLGVEINSEHLAVAANAVSSRSDPDRFRLERADFYQSNWPVLLKDLSDPLLVIGNPPWVTNATQGSLASDNLPVKSNLHGHRGIDAITGKANFDISEWMLLQMFDWLRGRSAVLAMLCKSAVARRVLVAEWQKKSGLQSATINTIDAESAFGAAVNACLLVATFSPGAHCDSATVFPTAETLRPNPSSTRIGWRDTRLIANLEPYLRRRHLCRMENASGELPTSKVPTWRSGVKHDCASVMELVERDGELWNGLGENVVIEWECLYPLLKSGDLAAGRTRAPRRWLVLPQRYVGDDTSRLETTVPKTWRYLKDHATWLDNRRSSIYRRQPPFAIFGIGEYTFAKWKVAVSGMAKRLRFAAVGSYRARPIVFDDTSYFLPCRSRREAYSRAELLNSPIVQDYFSAFVFWDAKRPITAELLRSLDLERALHE